jgi:hypothetical protein
MMIIVVAATDSQFRCEPMVTSNIAKQTSNVSYRKGFIRRARDRNRRALHLFVKGRALQDGASMPCLNDERDERSRCADLLRMWDCDGVGADRDSVTAGIAVRSCVDCGGTRCPGTSSIGKSGVKEFARCESSRRTRDSVNNC